jgi:ABC-type nitrate/sulfonate/bicarbonate transport system substrate-binding protein
MSGELAAVHTWEPYAAQGRAAGAKVLYTSHDADGLVMDSFMFSGETLRSRPLAVRRFLRAWFRAEEHWLLHPSEDNELLSARLAMSPGTVNLTGIHLLSLTEEHQAFEPGPTNRSARHVLQQFVDYFLSRGTLSAAPDLDQLLDAQYLPAAK